MVSEASPVVSEPTLEIDLPAELPTPPVRPAAVDPFSRGGRPSPQAPALPKDAFVELLALSDDPEEQLIKTRFAATTSEIHLTVKTGKVEAGKTLKTIWFPTADPDQRTVDSAVTSEQAETFSLAQPSQGWFDGDYTVQVEVAGEVLGETTFTIEAPEVVENPLEYAVLTVDLSTIEAAERLTDDLENIHLVVGSGSLEPGTPIRAVWRARSVPEFDPDEIVNSLTVEAAGPDKDVLFSFKPPRGGYHAGSYSVTLFVDRDQVQILDFSIEEKPDE